MPELILRSFIIDTVEPIVTEVRDESEEIHNRIKVQMVSYKVLAKDQQTALQRFFNEQAGVEVYRGDIVDRIVIGMALDSTGIMDIPSTNVTK